MIQPFNRGLAQVEHQTQRQGSGIHQTRAEKKDEDRLGDLNKTIMWTTI